MTRSGGGRRERPTWIVVPALDEEECVGACLDALQLAAARAPGPVSVVVVDDGSTDATSRVAQRRLAGWGLGASVVISGPSAGVGWARRAGVEYALDAAASGGVHEALVATTDADSRVVPDWLAAMHRRLDDGASVIAGDVWLPSTVDRQLAAARERRLRRRLHALPRAEAGAPHPHFAGSSLGFSLAALRRLGPLPTPASLEDEAILLRCRALGLAVTRDAEAAVITSPRTVGRATGGLATALAQDAEELASLRGA